ncbi:MAG: hypothetical protein ABJZ69_02035 [Hyphomicrobiales bacterium]
MKGPPPGGEAAARVNDGPATSLVAIGESEACPATLGGAGGLRGRELGALAGDGVVGRDRIAVSARSSASLDHVVSISSLLRPCQRSVAFFLSTIGSSSVSSHINVVIVQHWLGAVKKLN